MAFSTAPFCYQVDTSGKTLEQIAEESGVCYKTTWRFYHGYYDKKDVGHYPTLESVEKFMVYFHVSINGIIEHSLPY